MFSVLLLLFGCGGKKPAKVSVPPPPPGSVPPTAVTPAPEASTAVPKGAKPLYQEVGIASWYGAPYANRRTSNGEIYDIHALTAAHRTLPMNSVVRVTNVKTGQSAILRITDRGPFIEGRMLDLSVEAAKRLDVWRPGIARVKLEVLQAPAAIDSGGRWCVQIGALSSKKEAAKLKRHLERQYQEAQVLQFTGPTGEWVRLRVPGDDKSRIETVLRENTTPEGAMFLVRLD